MPVRRNQNAPYWVAIRALERTLILGALEAAKHNRSAAAKLLGIERSYLGKRMESLGITMQPTEDQGGKGNFLAKEEP